jgi:glycosyltransferase involved in cell wall biosynthesis
MSGFDWAIGVACALRPRKQLEHLFEGFGLLSTPRVRLFVAGFAVKGDERYAADLIADAKRRFDERFIFLGSLDDLRPLTNGLDLFINTSQEESFGIAVLEAMATGCPVIGYDSKAVDEVVLPNGGQITPQDDVVLLSQAIDQWLQNPSRIESARALAVSQAQRFDIRKLSGQLWDEYKAMLRESESGKRNSAITIC